MNSLINLFNITLHYLLDLLRNYESNNNFTIPNYKQYLTSVNQGSR